MSKTKDLLLTRKREVQAEIAKLTAAFQAELGEIERALAAIEGKAVKPPVRQKKRKSYKRKTPSTRDKALEILKIYRGGLTTAETTENYNSQHKQKVTARNMSWHLSKLKREGRVVLEGDLWKAKGSENEAPGSKEPSAPSHHGGGSGTLSSSGSEASSRSLAALPGANPADPGP